MRGAAPILLLALLSFMGCGRGEGEGPDGREGAGLSSPEAGFRVMAAGGAVPSPEEHPHRAVVVFWPGDSLRALRVARTLAERPDLPALSPGVPSGALIFLAPSEALFDSLIGGAVPEWGAGVAIPSRRTIVLPVYPAPRTRGWDEPRVLRHEWAHLGLHQELGGLRIPRWFDEGYAEWASGGWDVQEAWRLRVAMAMGRAPPLDDLALVWPRDRSSAELSYLLAATAVEYLVSSGGERGLALFLRRWIELEDFEAAVRRTYGLTGSQLEEAWRGYLRSRYGWLMVLSQSMLFWAGAALLLLVFVVIRRRRDRLHLARLRAGDPPDGPVWWMGEEESGVEGATEEGGGSDGTRQLDPERPLG